MHWRCFLFGVTCMVLVSMVASSERAAAAENTQTPFAVAGIQVDPLGVLKLQVASDRTGAILKQRIAEARSTLKPDLSKGSELRKVSLHRLETALKACLDRGEKPSEELLYLAGLTRVKYVFFYPETGDIVLAGPAQGWLVDPVGRVRGIETGVPIVELQDLIVALRAFPPDNQDTSVISCSIDPTREGLANMQAFLGNIGPRLAAGGNLSRQAQFIAQGLRQSLGLQNITIKGVPANTNFAKILVEADYRMKLIGIGLERPRIKLASYVELASSSSANQMQRWFFIPEYACVRVSEDKLGMELVGDGVKLVGEDEMVTADGMRVKSDRTDMAGKRFVQGFTAKYPELATKEPVYAQLRNIIDLSVAAAFIQQQDYYGQSGWTLGVFQDEAAFPVETLNVPRQVESAVNAVMKGNTLKTPIGGGVNIQPRQALADENLLTDEQEAVKNQREKLTLDHLADGQWWWD